MDPGRIILITGMIGLLALIMMLLALLSRRILGVRIGAVRTLMALIVAVGAEAGPAQSAERATGLHHP